jgi:exosortase D (VPLPA-CTERM-specific)
MRLQVVEACSGLRYLLPLTTIAFIAASLFHTSLWRRVVLVLSAAPITLLMNSARIAMTGVLVQFLGKAAAEGFLHDFEGWVVFLLCTVILVAEMALLVRIGHRKSTLARTFCFEEPVLAAPVALRPRVLPYSLIAAGTLIVAAAAVSLLLPERTHDSPPRKAFAGFPLVLGQWRGSADRLDPVYLPLLKLDDYLLADYFGGPGQEPVNFYVPYYASQANGNGAHSPRACIPGDGWEIADFRERSLARVTFGGQPLRVNRVVIQKGETRDLVYYWFQQRGRATTNEYLVKFYIFVDALQRGRTDGAMVRLVVRLRPGGAEEEGDRVLEDFAATAVPMLSAYVPE